MVFLPVHYGKIEKNTNKLFPINLMIKFWSRKILSSISVLFYGILIYTYVHGIIDHSGIAFKAFWWQPWQPDAIFHDNHHQYFHVNFGFNIYIWDTVGYFFFNIQKKSQKCMNHFFLINILFTRFSAARHSTEKESGLYGRNFFG